MSALVDKETSIAVAINSYIQGRGVNPANITELINTGYLPSDFSATNPIDSDIMTFSISNREIVISTEVETASISIAQKDYYLNNPYDRVLSKVTYESAGKLYSRFTLDDIANTNVNIATMSSFDDFRGSVEPSTYTSVSNGDFWFSSMYKDDTPTLFYRDSGLWKSTYNSNKNFDSVNGNFVNLNTIELIKSNWNTTTVNVTTQNEAIQCDNGATYNASANRCEAYTSSSCDYGYIWNESRSRCEKQPTCLSGYTYDASLNKCKKTTTYTATIEQSLSSCTLSVTEAFKSWIELWWFNDANPTISVGSQKIICSTKYTTIPATCNSNGTVTISNYGTKTLSIGNSFEGIFVLYYANRRGFFTSRVRLSSLNVSNSYTCLAGDTLNGTTCSTVTYTNPTCTLDAINDVCYEASTCSGKKMPVTPYYSTPYNGNNGVCYSDAGLYCKNTGVSWDGVYTCFDHSEHCDDATWNLRYDTDLCEKFNFSCSDTTYNRYGLATSPTNNDATDLYNRIASKDDKLNAVASAILSGDLDVNDNNGAMCTKLNYSTFTQPSPALDYTINSEIKSGF
jgi:hypothetical protein